MVGKNFFKQLGIAVAGGFIVLALISIFSWISEGGLIGLIGGVNEKKIVELRRKLREEMKGLTGGAVEESRHAVRERLDAMTVEIGSGKAAKLNEVYQAMSAGIVTATAALGGAGSCIIYGYAAIGRESLKSLRKPEYLRGSSALQYAPGPGDEDHGGLLGRYRHEDLHPYLPLDSITFPVRKNEFWSVAGCDDYDTEIKFYALELSDQ